MPASSSKSNGTKTASVEVPADKVIDQATNDEVDAAEGEAPERAEAIVEKKDERRRSFLPPREIDAEDGDIDAASEKEHADNLRRKRDREGSLEPSLSSQQGTTNQDTIPAKKNRLQDDAIKEEQASSSSVAAPSSPSMKSAEGEKVGQIRKRVQDLSWKQRKEGDRDALDEDKDGEGEEEEASVSESRPAVKESSSPKRTQPSFASYSSKPSAFASAKREDAASPPVSALDEDKTTASPPNGRTQPTFSSFSKSSSPFNSMSSVAGPSWLAGKSGSGSPASGGGGLRPSALGSVGSSNKPSIDAKEAFAPASSQEEKSTGPPSSGSKQLGFGAFSSNKTFSARSSTPTNATDGKVNGDDGEDTSTGKSFDEVLKQGNDNDEDEVVASKVSTQLPQGHADLKTGEEDEKTLTSARGKLYTMTEDKNWKERGTGTVRCNILKEKETSARLVMRSEGVLRLILNINLFKGMKIDLEQEKFLRIVALEDEKLVHFAIKFANQATATNFYRVVKQTIPSDDEQWDEEA